MSSFLITIGELIRAIQKLPDPDSVAGTSYTIEIFEGSGMVGYNVQAVTFHKLIYSDGPSKWTLDYTAQDQDVDDLFRAQDPVYDDADDVEDPVDFFAIAQTIRDAAIKYNAAVISAKVKANIDVNAEVVPNGITIKGINVELAL